jgi:hypothetical protein
MNGGETRKRSMETSKFGKVSWQGIDVKRRPERTLDPFSIIHDFLCKSGCLCYWSTCLLLSLLYKIYIGAVCTTNNHLILVYLFKDR